MMMDSLKQRLREILREVRRQAPHDRLETDADFVKVLGLDSLDVGNFVIEVENTFLIRLGVEQVDDLDTLDKLSAFIAKTAPVAVAAIDETPASHS